MNTDLQSMWLDINQNFFRSRLRPISDIDYHFLITEEDSLEAFALYKYRGNFIALDERFRFNPVGIKAGDLRENAKLEASYSLVMHEMIHQADFEDQPRGAGRHGARFIALATSLAQAANIPPPTPAEAALWPDIRPLLARYAI